MANRISTRQWPDRLLSRLQEAQRGSGFLSPDIMVRIAHDLALPLHDVYGVASFYSFLSRAPRGRNIIRICKSVPCYLKNNQIIIDTIRRELGIEAGGTTPEGRFSLEFTNCLGLCDKPPAMLINDDPHVDLNPGKIANILGSYR